MSLLDQLPDAVLRLDADRRIVEANAAAAELTGFPAEKLIGSGCASKLIFSWGGNPGVGSLHRLRDAVENNWPAPLGIEEHEVAVRDGVRVSRFSYASPKGGRVDGMLVRPVKVKKTGAIIWAHSGGYFNQLSDAVLMAHNGAVSLLVDPTGGMQSAEAARDAMVQTIVDIRRAVDILAARPDVDSHRIAFVGHSYGAMMGAVAAAVDKRFKAPDCFRRT